MGQELEQRGSNWQNYLQALAGSWPNIPGSSLPWQKQLYVSYPVLQTLIVTWRTRSVPSRTGGCSWGGTEMSTFQAQGRGRSQSCAAGQQWFQPAALLQTGNFGAAWACSWLIPLCRVPHLRAQPPAEPPSLLSHLSHSNPLQAHLLPPVSCCWGKKTFGTFSDEKNACSGIKIESSDFKNPY